MELRRLGQTDLHVSPIIFGSMARRRASAKDRIALIQAAIDRGITTIDTAPLYGFGASEVQLGCALKGMMADKVKVLTKVGLRWDAEDHGRLHFETTRANGAKRFVRRNSRPDSVRWEVEQSLRRIQVDRIDLVQVHFPDAETPIPDTMGALLDLRREGKLKHIGVSNFSRSQVAAAQAALGDIPLCSVQSKYNVLQRDIEQDVLPLCVENGVGVVAYSPLAEGLLAGRERSGTKNKVPTAVTKAIRNVLIPFAINHGVPPAAVALRWLISRPGVSAAIVGASHLSQLDEHLQALDFEPSPEELDALSQAFSNVQLIEPWKRNRVRTAGRRLVELVDRVRQR